MTTDAENVQQNFFPTTCHKTVRILVKGYKIKAEAYNPDQSH